jgi:hypothetical protein
MNARYMLYGMAVAAITLAGSLSAQAQDIKFNDTPYSTPVFSATFPVDEVVTHEESKNATSDQNIYSSVNTKRSEKDSKRLADPIAVFMVAYVDYTNTNITKVDLKKFLDGLLDGSVNDFKDIPSTLGGLDGLATLRTIMDSDGDEQLHYVRVAAHGNRMWTAQVICFVCGQADADKFFNSIKIK